MFNTAYKQLYKPFLFFSFYLAIVGCSSTNQIEPIIRKYEIAINTAKTYEERLIKIKPYIDESAATNIKYAQDIYNSTKSDFECLPVMGIPNFNKVMLEEISNSEVMLTIGDIRVENEIAYADVLVGIKLNGREYELEKYTIILKRKNSKWLIHRPPVYKLDPLTDIEKLYVYVLSSRGRK